MAKLGRKSGEKKGILSARQTIDLVCSHTGAPYNPQTVRESLSKVTLLPDGPLT